MSPKKRRAPRVEDLRPHERSMVLTRLAQRTDAVGKAVRDEIERLIASVDVEAVAADVELDLEHIDEDEIAARSGSHRYGYTAPYEAVWQVLEEILQPHVERIPAESDRAVTRIDCVVRPIRLSRQGPP